jgi:small subunit ribosomal protein S3
LIYTLYKLKLQKLKLLTYMGRKVNPKGFRLGITTNWNSRWFSKKDYSTLLEQDLKLRKYLKTKFKDASISKIDIERLRNNINIIIHSAKPGMIIGRGGVGIEGLKQELQKKFIEKFISQTGQKYILNIDIKEISKPNLDASIVLQGIIADIEKRMPFRRVMKQAISRVEKAGAKGVKIMVSGRLNGVEIARTESLSSGKLPLQTLRAEIDYDRGTARTIFGAIGVKVWIYTGEKFK